MSQHNIAIIKATRSDYIKLLLAFSALPRTTQNLTVFEVAGFPHYENVVSNILAFYFDPRRDHGMGSLLLDSLFALLGENKIERIKEVQIPDREFPTIAGGRIDLLIKTSSHVVGIENKIFAEIYNDLDDYWDTIQKVADSRRRTIGIVLSLKKIPIRDSRFKYITYTELWREVKSQLGHRIQKSDTKWVQYLFDLMDTTKNLMGPAIEITQEDEFFIQYDAVISQLVEERSKFLFKLQSSVAILKTMIEKSPLIPFTKQGIWEETCLLHEFTMQGHTIVFDFYVEAAGWQLQIFVRNGNLQSQAYLEALLKERRSELTFDKGRFNAEKRTLNESLKEIRDYLCGWMQWLTEASAKYAAVSHE
jgi:PD-(D/E)XK nuclease superfamily